MERWRGHAWLWTALAAAGLWLTGFVWFVAAMPVAVTDVQTHTDAIVVLTGGRDRLNTGVALLEAGMADRLFVSGVHKGVDGAEILRAAHLEASKELVSRLELGHEADDTVGNAEETNGWVRGNKIASVRLVTADYHMQRSLWEFHRMMPDTAIIPHPVFPEHGRLWSWGHVVLLANEYTKLAVAVVRNRVKGES